MPSPQDGGRPRALLAPRPSKYPRIVIFIDALPKGATGEILKPEIVVKPCDGHDGRWQPPEGGIRFG